jgi:hypothetical protein
LQVFICATRAHVPFAVMSEGKVAEAGNPVELLRREGSLFKAYMDQNLQINAENAAASVSMSETNASVQPVE